MYLRNFSSDHLLVHVGTVASNINELPFALRANTHFAVPDITFLAKHPVIFFFHIFVSATIQEAKAALVVLCRQFSCNKSLFCSCTCEIISTAVYSYNRYWL